MRKAAVLLAIAAALFLAGWITTPPSLSLESASSPIAAEPSASIRKSETEAEAAFGLVAGTEKRIRWHGTAGEKTGLAVVYVHGFSASRQEIAPVPELVAASLGANLFETRLKGHGRERQRLDGISAEDWLADGIEALTVGAALGERLIIIGTSTGATLAIAMANHELFETVDTLVLMSPNYGLPDPASVWLTRPFGPLLARAMIGEYREWQPANERQAEYWTTRYPTAAIVEMMRLVDYAAVTNANATVPRAFLIYSPEDRVVSVDKMLDGFERLPAGDKVMLATTATNDPGGHVLAGDILSPTTTAETVEQIVSFVTAGRTPR